MSSLLPKMMPLAQELVSSDILHDKQKNCLINSLYRSTPLTAFQYLCLAVPEQLSLEPSNDHTLLADFSAVYNEYLWTTERTKNILQKAAIKNARLHKLLEQSLKKLAERSPSLANKRSKEIGFNLSNILEQKPVQNKAFIPKDIKKIGKFPIYKLFEDEVGSPLPTTPEVDNAKGKQRLRVEAQGVIQKMNIVGINIQSTLHRLGNNLSAIIRRIERLLVSSQKRNRAKTSETPQASCSSTCFETPEPPLAAGSPIANKSFSSTPSFDAPSSSPSFDQPPVSPSFDNQLPTSPSFDDLPDSPSFDPVVAGSPIKRSSYSPGPSDDSVNSPLIAGSPSFDSSPKPDSPSPDPTTNNNKVTISFQHSSNNQDIKTVIDVTKTIKQSSFQEIAKHLITQQRNQKQQGQQVKVRRRLDFGDRITERNTVLPSNATFHTKITELEDEPFSFNNMNFTK